MLTGMMMSKRENKSPKKGKIIKNEGFRKYRVIYFITLWIETLEMLC